MELPRLCPGVDRSDGDGFGLRQPVRALVALELKPLGTACGLFCVGFPIKEDFLKQSEQLFGAKPMSLTGRKGDDLLNINQWVKEATEGKIEDFLSELPDDTVLLLLNAIHFQGAFPLFSGPLPLWPLFLPCRLNWAAKPLF